MPRKSIGQRPMTDAERQARHRAACAAGALVSRSRRPTDHRGRARRWHDAVAELTEAQTQYATWLQALPTNLQDSALAAALQAICDLDLAEFQAIGPTTRIRQGLTSRARASARHTDRSQQSPWRHPSPRNARRLRAVFWCRP